MLVRLSPFAVEGVRLIDSQIQTVNAKKAAADMNVTVASQAVELQRLSGESMTQSLSESVEAAEKKWEQTKNEVDAFQAEFDDKLNQQRIAEEVSAKGPRIP